MIEERPYQSGAIEWLAKRKRGLVQSPAGSGKTVIAALALHRVIHSVVRSQPVKVGWLANTEDQCRQAETALNAAGLNGPIDRKIACAAGNPDMSDRDVLVVDEAHHATAPQWASIIQGCEGALWAFSATPFGPDEFRNNQIMEMFSEVYEIPRNAVPNIAKAKVKLLDATDPNMRKPMDAEIQRLMAIRKRWHQGSEQELWSRVAYQVCMKRGIEENKARNGAIIQLANHHVENGDCVLVLVFTVEHAKQLAQSIQGAVPCFSKMGKKKRLAAIQGVRDGDIPCMVATSLADEGLDIPRLNTLILASGGKAPGRIEQRTGRVLRTFQGKQHGLIYDFLDNQHPLTRKHSEKRRAIYERLGYEIEIGGLI